jgi:hypothetical protein
MRFSNKDHQKLKTYIPLDCSLVDRSYAHVKRADGQRNQPEQCFWQYFVGFFHHFVFREDPHSGRRRLAPQVKILGNVT